MDVLREGEAHARKPAERRVKLPDELCLCESAGPLHFGFQLHEELDVVERRHVRAVVGAPQLRDDVGHNAKAPQRLADLVRQLGRRLERDVHGQRGPHPQVAFLELRHEFAAHQLHQQEPEGKRPTGAREHGSPALQDSGEQARVAAGQPGREAWRGGGRAGTSPHPRREDGREHEREQQRAGQGEPVRQGHRREDPAGHAPHREQGQKGDEDHEGREEHRLGRFGRGLGDHVEGRLAGRPAGQSAVNVFHDHDRGVHENAEVDRADRDEVGRIPRRDHQSEGEQDRQRDGERGNERHAHVAQKHQEQAGHERQPEQYEVPHGAGGHVNQVRAIIDGVQPHPRR